MKERFAGLVVDDDALILRTVERVMHPYSDITTAGSVKAAQEILAGVRTFAAIVSDLRMLEATALNYCSRSMSGVVAGAEIYRLSHHTILLATNCRPVCRVSRDSTFQQP